MGSANYIFANTGQLVRLVIQTLDSSGLLTDGYVPIVLNILFPDLSKAAGYPRNMTKLDTGLYAHGFQVPSGLDALGTYIAQIYWEESGQPKYDTYAINVARPFGVSVVTQI